MKLLRFGEVGNERPGILDSDGNVRDLSAHVTDLAGETISCDALDALRELDPDSLPLVESPGRIGCCLGYVTNFHCIGLNYAQHAHESNMQVPAEPILFSKATTALSGPFDPVVLPHGAEKGDWEVELGVVIGRKASNVSESEALSHVAGYCSVNDVSERAFQLERGGQWVKGKSAPTFGPVGPWLVTADEVPDPQNLSVRTLVNGEVVQDSNTSDMIFTVAQIISYMSKFMILAPGDIIATGTPQGVGMGMSPPRFLRPGDVMEVEVGGLGAQRQETVAAN